MILVDTGFLLALVQPRDALYRRARAWTAFVREPMLVTEYVLLETVNGLSAVPDRAKAAYLASELRSSSEYRFIFSSAALLNDGLELHRNRNDKDWSLTDCISFVVMQTHGATAALTHDHHFEQAGFDALLRRDPP